jgi:uncharacterized protein DUF3237
MTDPDPKARGRGARSSDVAPSLRHFRRYYFSVQSSVSVPETKRLAKGPLGTRVNVVYSSANSRVFTKDQEYTQSWNRDVPSTGNCTFEWDGLEGQILSGGDFALIRTDGVLALDGRVTIQANDGTLIDAIYRGLVDLDLSRSAAALASEALMSAAAGNEVAAVEAALEQEFEEKDKVRSIALAAVRKIFSKGARQAKARTRALEAMGAGLAKEYRARERRIYEEFINGELSLGDPDQRGLPLQLSISFETGSGPWSDAPDEDLSWVGKQYRVNQDHFWKYRKLLRSQFVASGKLAFRRLSPGTLPVAEKIELDIYELLGAA